MLESMSFSPSLVQDQFLGTTFPRSALEYYKHGQRSGVQYIYNCCSDTNTEIGVLQNPSAMWSTQLFL